MIKNFIKLLKSSPDKDDVFNPWWESDKDHDISAEAPAIRRRQVMGSSLLLTHVRIYKRVKSRLDNHIKAVTWTQDDFVLSRNWSNTYCASSVTFSF